MTSQLNLIEPPPAPVQTPVEPKRRSLSFNPKEYKVVALRECPTEARVIDTPERAASYWREHVATHPYYSPDVECFTVLMLSSRRRIMGHHLVSTGTMDTLLVHPVNVFRAAIIMSAAAVVLTHNHPSGDSTPSEADIKVTRDLIRAGQLLKVEVLDHIIVGSRKLPDQPEYRSLRELGYFFV
jgi:DNA repair protein RadC